MEGNIKIFICVCKYNPWYDLAGEQWVKGSLLCISVVPAWFAMVSEMDCN